MTRRSEMFDYEPVTPSKKLPFPKKSATDQRRGMATNACESKSRRAAEGSEKSINRPNKGSRRIHGLSYIFLFLFTAVLFFRPYEFIPALSGVKSLAYWSGLITLTTFVFTQLTLEGYLTERPREVNLVLLLCLFGLLSIPFAIDPHDAWLTFSDTFIRAILIFIVMLNVVRTERRLHGLFFLSLSIGLLLSIGAINDYRTGNFAQQGERIVGFVGGMFGNANDLALFLVMVFPMSVGIMAGSRNVLVKVFCASCAVLSIAAIVATFSRGGFLALVAAALVLVWKLGRRQRIATMSVAIIIIAALVVLSPGGYGDRILSIFGLRPDTGSASARQAALTHSIYTALRNPVGIGMGNYHIVASHETVSHNAYTQVAAEMGVLAFVCYVWFLVAPLKRLSKIEQETMNDKGAKRHYYLAVGLYSSLFGYLVGSFFASVAYQWYIYYFAGYAICFSNLPTHKLNNSENQQLRSRT